MKATTPVVATFAAFAAFTLSALIARDLVLPAVFAATTNWPANHPTPVQQAARDALDKKNAAEAAADKKRADDLKRQQGIGCTWPDEVTLRFKPVQLVVLNAWLSEQDYSHKTWESLQQTLGPQFAALQAAACKEKHNAR